MNLRLSKAGAIFWIYACRGAVRVGYLVSALSGVGDIGLGLNAIKTGTSELLIGQLSTISLRASGLELGSRLGGYSIGIDSGENLRNAAIGFGGGVVLNSAVVKGVSFSNVTGPAFRSISTGRFVSNNYGALRFGVTSHGQSGLITNSIYNMYFK